MYATCLHCHRSLGRNDAIEHFPIGRRLAFDAAKGRLWVVCGDCQRWNLTPIEERWEAIEECEREFRALKVRAQTENIGLARLADGAELIRIGRPLRPEFAAWRYGSVLQHRFRRRATVGVAVGAAVGAGTLAVTGAVEMAAQLAVAPFLLLPAFHISIAAFSLRNNLIATKVLGENGTVLRVVRSNLDHSRVLAGAGEPLQLLLEHSTGKQLLTGDRALRALSTLLARVNGGGGTHAMVDGAANLIARAGDPELAIAELARDAERRAGDFEERSAEFARGPHGRTFAEAFEAQHRAQMKRGIWKPNTVPPRNPGALHRLPRVQRLALEMALHETSERFALDQDLATLERAWREAEEIAAIADLLLDLPTR